MHVLFVDDNPYICKVFAELTRSLGHQASVATTAAGALETAGRKNLDLVFLDVARGLTRGVQICLQLRYICPHAGMRIVSMSNSPNARALRAAALFDGFVPSRLPGLHSSYACPAATWPPTSKRATPAPQSLGSEPS